MERLEGDVVTSDGGTVHVRPIRPDDAPRVEAFHARQSAESIYLRYFSARPQLSAAEINQLTHVDQVHRMGFVALLGDDVVGIARYDRFRGRDEAEVAFSVDDEHRGRGLGPILLEYLVAAAREVGLHAFTATVLPSNRRMLTVFHQAGFETVSAFADGVIEVRFAIDPTAEAEAAMAARGRAADAASVARLLAPTSVAVIGAGQARGGLGHEAFRRLLEHDFAGPVYPVNRAASHVASVRAYPSVLDVPDRVDLAVIAVPAAEVPAVVAECARARVGGLVVLAAGFAETGPEGEETERALVADARGHGMRVVGPNSLGLINTAPDVRLHATFAPIAPLPGRVAFSAQSGALAAAIVNRATALRLGISAMVSVGNKGDVSGNDLLRYWHTDERTDVVLLYLESFGNPRRFGRIATEVSRDKPIVAVMAGRDARTDALLDQTGVIRVDTLDRLLDVGRVLAGQPVPRGNRVAVLGNSGGPALLAADACRAAGLVVASVGSDSADALIAVLPSGARVDGPIDLTYAAGPDAFGAATRIALADPGVDAALVLYAPILTDDVEAVAAAIAAEAERAGAKPVVAAMPSSRRSGVPSLPRFDFPDAAAYALGRAASYAAWRAELEGVVPKVEGVDEAAARAIVDAALATDPLGTWLTPQEAHALLLAAGLAVIELRFVDDAKSAATAATELGFPVALKATHLDHLPKTEASGVALDLQDAGEVERAFKRMQEALPGSMAPAAVQRMAPPGADLRVRVLHDEVVGAAVGLGPGGAAGEPLADDSVRLVPLTDTAAVSLIDSCATAASLPDAERAAVAELVLRVAWLADTIPEIAELVCNPVLVGPSGAWIADGAVRVAPWRVDQEPPVRRLGLDG